MNNNNRPKVEKKETDKTETVKTVRHVPGGSNHVPSKENKDIKRDIIKKEVESSKKDKEQTVPDRVLKENSFTETGEWECVM